MNLEEKIEHIAKLANLKLTDDKEKMKKQIPAILTEIDKILALEVDEEVMISPSLNVNNFEDDLIKDHIEKEQLFKNSKNKTEIYIKVPKVIE